jgi:phosphatidylserine decarboxylase
MTVPAVTPELPSRKWRAILAVLSRLPKAGLSRSLGVLADVPLPGRLRKTVLKTFVAATGIDMDEAARPLTDYGSINELFVRKLRPGARRWPGDPDLVTSPVDGIVGQVGMIDGGRIIQAKGRDYSAADLLSSVTEAAEVDGGDFLTLYLAPRHYHRIHAPVGGVITRARHVPGTLFPVNEPSVDHIENLFARNERLLTHIHAEVGRVTVVAVGAYNVGRISAAFDPHWSGDQSWVTNRKAAEDLERTYDPSIRVDRGEEIMAFHMGSTVILLFQPGQVELDRRLHPGVEIRLGEVIARPVEG